MTIAVKDIKKSYLKQIEKIAMNKRKEVINNIIKKGLENRTENTVPEHLIINKDTYNPNSERIMKIAGIIKTDKQFNTAKAID